MLEVTRQQLVQSFQALGIKPGDGLLVHSALQFLGRPVDGIETYLEALREVVPQGTITVPTFNFAFAQAEPYDPRNTPAAGMGAFSEYVRQQPGARRTSHPLQSLAVIGRHADELARCDTPSAFDPGSAFERMIELDFKILLLGAHFDAISLIHYSEQRLSVPYRYWKNFSGQVWTPAGWEQRTYRMYVRDLSLDPHLTLDLVRDKMIANGQYHRIALNYGEIGFLKMRDFVPIVDRYLAENPYSLMRSTIHPK